MTDHIPPSPFGPDLWDVLARYVAGESPEAEALAVREWLNQDVRRTEMLDTLNRAIGALAFRPAADLDIEAGWRRVSDRVQDDVKVFPMRRREEHAGRTWGTVGLRAAAVVALLVGGVAVWRTTREAEVAAPVRVAQTYTTPVGRTVSITLDDGSRVVIGPGSELIVGAGFGITGRPVEFRGEALFEVTHDERRPFTVQAGSALIEDLGTTFTVRHDTVEGVRVVVTEGTVRLQGPDRQQGPEKGGVVLKPGDRGTVGRDGRAVAQPRSATPDDLAWTRGQLVFDDAPLARVQTDLKRWYGVELKVDDPALASRHLTASFAGEPIERVLGVIGLALGARIERHGDTAVVRAR